MGNAIIYYNNKKMVTLLSINSYVVKCYAKSRYVLVLFIGPTLPRMLGFTTNQGLEKVHRQDYRMFP